MATKGVNGVTESFSHAVASPSHLSLLNSFLFLLSLIYISLTLFLISHMGAAAVIASNCVCMTLRIFASAFYMKIFFSDSSFLSSLSSSLPSSSFLSLSLFSFFATQISANIFSVKSVFAEWKTSVLHLAIGITLFGLVLFSLYVYLPLSSSFV